MKMLLALLFFSQTCFANELDKKVTVTGHCLVETTPDRGSINFVITHVDPSAKTAILKSTLLYEKLRDELKKSNVKNLELSSTEYNVFERKEWENNKSVSKGFECRYGLKASTTAISSLGDLIAIAARLGVTETHSLHIELSEEKSMEEKKKCLDIAARNARDKADILVKSLGAKLGKILKIAEIDSAIQSPPSPIYEKAMVRATMDATPPPGIEAQKLTINQTVEATFTIE